jgi:uncharacterized protein (DUF1015 family)
MARIFPFRPYRYAPAAGKLDDLVTQPYDKISPAMQARYLSLSPYNLVRIILGERHWSDSDNDNVYTRAARHLGDWIAGGILQQENEPSLFAYFQEFTEPDTGERLTRQGFIGLGAVEDYSANVVYRHEQTLSGPKQDRLELLRHTQAHFGQLFMLYADPAGEVDRILEAAAQAPPAAAVTDEYGATHRMWKLADPQTISRIQTIVADKKLLIADGHHRYETALAFRNEHPGADKVMMTFVNMHSPGLRILATHRLLSNLPAFDPRVFLEKARQIFEVTPVENIAQALPGGRRIGVAVPGSQYILENRNPDDRLDVEVLHDVVLHKILGIGPEAVREGQHVRYIRGLDAAIEEVRSGGAAIGFLLNPTSVEDVARVSFAGGVMPQKSTDFYPKLLSGLTIYKLESTILKDKPPCRNALISRIIVTARKPMGFGRE